MYTHFTINQTMKAIDREAQPKPQRKTISVTPSTIYLILTDNCYTKENICSML